jgi:hypothetical protein
MAAVVVSIPVAGRGRGSSAPGSKKIGSPRAGRAAELILEPAALGFQGRCSVGGDADDLAVEADDLLEAEVEGQAGQLGPGPAVPAAVLRPDRLAEGRDAEQVPQRGARAKAALRGSQQRIGDRDQRRVRR